MNVSRRIALTLALLFTAAFAPAQTNEASASAKLSSKPLSLPDALDIAIRQNAAILKAKADLKANYGVVVQLRSIALPKFSAFGNYTANDPGSIEKFPSGPSFTVKLPNEKWSANLQLTQSVYEGGRIQSSLRSARLTREEAKLNFQTVVSDTILAVRIAYDDILLASEQIKVQEASVNLLTQELADVQRRFNAGTVPRFNVLRAEVELANARPKLIRAKNAFRIAKNNLANLLGYDLPKNLLENIPLELSGKLQADPYDIELPAALGQALEKRTELAALRKAENLRREDVVNAKAGFKPSAQLFAGYGWRSPSFQDDLSRDVSGWVTGAQVSWNIFDGALTRGKIIEAEARRSKAGLEIEDASRRIELEVRTAYSNFIEAKEVLESQKKVQEEAEEALRLAEARMNAGTGTQLDVLNAQTALTEARTTQAQALHDYSVARSRLERSIGQITEASAGSH